MQITEDLAIKPKKFLIKSLTKYFDHELFFDKLLDKLKECNNIKHLIYPDFQEKENEKNDLFSRSDNLTKLEQKRYGDLIKELKDCKLSDKVIIVKSIDIILEAAAKHKLYLCRKNKEIYCFNGKFWKVVEEDTVKDFLGKSMQKIGVELNNAKYHKTINECYLQLYRTCIEPSIKTNDSILINLNNGTLEIDIKQNKGIPILKDHNHLDFLTYCLNFDYNPESKSPIFNKYLNEVQPDIAVQKVLSEYIGSVFISNNVAKIEKILLIHGTGGNGKSVFMEILTALLGNENVTHLTLEVLTNPESFYRHRINNKLLNYSSDASPKLNPDELKKLASGEPLEVCVKHKEGFEMLRYAKNIVNMNQLPHTRDLTEGYFRRFLIVEFSAFNSKNKTKANKNLHNEIINNELSGVLNWILEGLKRFIFQNYEFTESQAINQNLEKYKTDSNPLKEFIDQNYKASSTNLIPLSTLLIEFNTFLTVNGFPNTTSQALSKGLKMLEIELKRTGIGNQAFLDKI